MLYTGPAEQDFPVVQGRFWLRQRGGNQVFFSQFSYNIWRKMYRKNYWLVKNLVEADDIFAASYQPFSKLAAANSWSNSTRWNLS